MMVGGGGGGYCYDPLGAVYARTVKATHTLKRPENYVIGWNGSSPIVRSFIPQISSVLPLNSNN